MQSCTTTMIPLLVACTRNSYKQTHSGGLVGKVLEWETICIETLRQNHRKKTIIPMALPQHHHQHPKNETPRSWRADNHSDAIAYDNHESTVDGVDPQQLSANPQRASGESGRMGNHLHRDFASKPSQENDNTDGFATISSPSTAITAHTFLNQQ